MRLVYSLYLLVLGVLFFAWAVFGRWGYVFAAFPAVTALVLWVASAVYAVVWAVKKFRKR